MLPKILVCCSLFFASVGASITLFLKPTPPQLYCPSSIDIGAQQTSSMAIARFEVNNTGESTLLIESIGTSCSCAGIEFDFGSSATEQTARIHSLTIQPKGTIKLLARIAVNAPVGHEQKVSIFGKTNDPNQPVWQTTISIPNVLGGVTCQPAAVVFEPSDSESEPVQDVVVYENGVSNRTIKQVRFFPEDRFVGHVLAPPLDTPNHPTWGRAIGMIRVQLKQPTVGPIWGKMSIETNDYKPTERDYVLITGESLPQSSR